MSLQIGPSSALNLTLRGTFGSFSVGKTGIAQSIKAEYLLTHVSLDFEHGSNEELLRHLVPVRELFDIQSLGFEELMQRDIDDARVSNELIPYLLHETSPDLVKLFPPIVVVVAPLMTNERRPAPFYPLVRVEEVPADPPTKQYPFLVTQSGATGAEAYMFERPILNEQPQDHDLVNLKLNTNKVSLVIVDGQHRAMALLALFRNLKDDWSDAMRSPYKEYYAQWPGSLIRSFDLGSVSLPIMFCTFPDLDENCSLDYDVMRASRSVFLTLNKSARSVSTSRNRLLDDNDLVSSFLRSTLSEIKNKSEQSTFSLRIHCVELDQTQNRSKISDPIAITGVNHIFHMIEHLFVGRPDEDVDRINFKRTRRRDRVDLAVNPAGLDRLDAENNLRSEQLQSTTRTYFDDATEKQLRDLFKERIGCHIVKFFEAFQPFERHNAAVLSMNSKLDTQEDNRVKPILFGGQGMERTFEAHRDLIKIKTDRLGPDAPSALRASADQLDATYKKINAEIEAFKKDRADRYLASVSDKSPLKASGEYLSRVSSFVDELYSNIFATVAFQTAAVCIFFDGITLASGDFSGEEIKEEFDNYLDDLNSIFVPKTVTHVRRLVEIFKGSINGSISNWDIVERAPATFRQVVYRAEMQPDQWPKYKAIFLEVWAPKSENLGKYVSEEREKVRQHVLSGLLEFNVQSRSRELNKRPEHFTAAQLDGCKKRAVQNYHGFLKNVLGSNVPDIGYLEQLAEEVSDTDREESD